MTATEEKDRTDVLNLSAKIGERFSDYVLIVRIPDGLRWKYSDRTFARGACDRLIDRLSYDDQPPVQVDP